MRLVIQSKFMNILLICLLILSVLTLVAINFSNDELSQYRKQVDSHKFMKHALGGVQGHTYLNTIEALDRFKLPKRSSFI